jgi:hypothetical protein
MNNLWQFELPVAEPAVCSGANQNFKAFIEQHRRIATEAGFDWHIRLDKDGVALRGQAWDLRAMANDGRPSPIVLRTFSHVDAALKKLAARGTESAKATSGLSVSSDWQDLIKAHAIEHILIRKKGVNHVAAASAALRLLATVTSKAPWQINAEDVQLACEVADECQPSGGTSIVLRGIIGSLIDPLHLFDACPLSALVIRPILAGRGRAKFAKVEAKQSKTLDERKAEEKLPERKAFWEITRIVFTERPKSLNDALRFAMIKVLLMTGLRVNEVALLPFDWRRTRTYVDESGQPAGNIGGVSEAMLIRHFAEKQDNSQLYEATQFVPLIFQKELESTLAEVERLTAPLRETLKRQYETGRIFPMHEPDKLVPVTEMYRRLSGNAVWARAPLPKGVDECLDRYAATLDTNELEEIERLQSSATSLSVAVSRYFSPIRRMQGLQRYSSGDSSISTHQGMTGGYLRIREVESYVRQHLPTKISDLKCFDLDNGQKLAPHEMLFLMPKRAVGEGRGQTTLNPKLTFSVGVADPALLHVALGAEGQKDRSLFSIYGQNEGDRNLSLKTHSFRHLQNTELFRLGIADTIITKRFNRRSVTQSYVYDHRSLAEDLDNISLPNEWDLMIGESNAATVAKLITAGRANGPIVREFKRIQSLEGDAAALQFLSAEADGFHATPYGTCLNSFTVDPCPKHLECFSGCRHLSATNLPEHQDNIAKLHGRLKIALEHANARPNGSVGKDNQISHITVRIEGVERLINTGPGLPVFPEGKDLSLTDSRRSVLDGT